MPLILLGIGGVIGWFLADKTTDAAIILAASYALVLASQK